MNGATDDLFGYGDPRGVHELRVALASYLGRSRAVRAHPDQIVIFSGFAEALSILAETLRELGRTTIAVEDPALPFHPVFCIRAGLAVERVPVDDDGLQVDRLTRESPTPCWSPPPTNTRSESRWPPRVGSPSSSGRGRQEDGSSRTTTTASFASTANPSVRCRDSIRAESSTAAPRASHSQLGCTSRGSCCRRRSSSP